MILELTLTSPPAGLPRSPSKSSSGICESESSSDFLTKRRLNLGNQLLLESSFFSSLPLSSSRRQIQRKRKGIFNITKKETIIKEEKIINAAQKSKSFWR